MKNLVDDDVAVACVEEMCGGDVCWRYLSFEVEVPFLYTSRSHHSPRRPSHFNAPRHLRRRARPIACSFEVLADVEIEIQTPMLASFGMCCMIFQPHADQEDGGIPCRNLRREQTPRLSCTRMMIQEKIAECGFTLWLHSASQLFGGK